MTNMYWVVLVLFLASCSAIPEWLGGEADEEILEGDRISVLKLKGQVDTDYELEDLRVVVPYPSDNLYWYKSSGFHILTESNPRLPDSFSSPIKTSIGHGGEGVSRLASVPVVAKGRVYTIDSSGLVSSYDVNNTRKPLWKVRVLAKKTKFRSGQGGLVYDAGKLFVTIGSNDIASLDALTGDVLWRRKINSVSRSAPAASNGRVFVNTIDNRLYAMDANTGDILWTHIGIQEELSVYGSASPFVADKLVVVPYSSGEIYALKVADGAEIWSDSYTLDRSNTSDAFVDVEASPVLYHDRVVGVSSSGVLAITELFTGLRAWEKEISSTQTPWVAGDFLFIIDRNSQLICVHLPSGGVKWIKKLPEYKKPKKKKGPIKWSGPIMAGSKVLVVGSHGRMLAVSPNNGAVIQEYEVAKEVYLPPVVAYDKLFLLDNDGVMYTYSGSKE